MKRMMKAGLLIVLVAVLAISTISMAFVAVGLPMVQPNVGWNTGATTYEPALSTAWIMPVIQPCVGWNT
jgi:hypothetical protein